MNPTNRRLVVLGQAAHVKRLIARSRPQAVRAPNAAASGDKTKRNRTKSRRKTPPDEGWTPFAALAELLPSRSRTVQRLEDVDRCFLDKVIECPGDIMKATWILTDDLSLDDAT